MPRYDGTYPRRPGRTLVHGLTHALTRSLTRPLYGIRVGVDALWILSLLTNDDTTVTNATALVFLNDDVAADGLTLVDLPDDVPILNGAQWNSTTEAYSFTLSDGTKTHKLIEPEPQTTNGPVPTIQPIVAWSAADSVAEGDLRKVSTTEGLDCYVAYTAGGTTAGSQPTVAISDIGGGAISDNDTSFLVKGLQTAEGLFSSLALTNKVTAVKANPSSLGSLVREGDADAVLSLQTESSSNFENAIDENGVPVDLTTICSTLKVYELDNTLGSALAFVRLGGVTGNTNKHNVSAYAKGVGVVSTFNGTLSEQTAPIYERIQFVVDIPQSTADMIILVNPGETMRFILPQMVESTLLGSIVIGDDTAASQTQSSTVTSTPIAETKLKAEESFILITGNPDRAGQTGALASTYTNADNSTEILINTTDITLRKRITTTDNDAVVSYTHAADTPFAVIAIWDGTNMRITAIAVGGTFPAYETDANTASAILGSTLESFSRNGGEQFQGEGLNVMSFTSEATLIAFVDANNLADTSNL